MSIGAHGQREGLGAHWDLWSFALGGMSNMEVLKTGTINPARALGLDKDLGPLENIRNSTSVSMTMVGGKLYDSELQVVAGGTGGFKPFWFQEQAGGAFTAGTTAGVPKEAHEED